MKTRAWIILIITATSSFTFSYLLSQSQVAVKTVTVTEAIPETFSISDEQYGEAVRDLLQYVGEWVESRRGLSLKEDVEIVVLTREWVVEHWGVGGLNLTQVRIEEAVLKSLFLVPEDFNLTEFKVRVSGYMIAGAADHTIYVVKEFFDPSNRVAAGSTLAHELMHILQGEYFSLPRPSSTDEQNAFSALVEGEAGLIGSQYLVEHGSRPHGPSPESILEPLEALWLFPYIYGEPFVGYAYERGGWGMVDALYRDPPQSTAQILHPEKCLDGWKPIRVDPPQPPGEGWSLIYQDIMGEFFIRQVLRAHLDGLSANKSAEGWKGDVLQLYERDNGYMLRWKILWENKDEAAEFSETFTRMLKSIGTERISERTWIAGHRLVELQIEDQVTLITVVYDVRSRVTEGLKAGSLALSWDG
jgi:hypothetical protein